MHSARSIIVLCLLAPLLAGCSAAAMIALGLVSGGGGEPAAARQSGPMAESAGQQLVQQALGMLDPLPSDRCAKHLADAEPVASPPSDGRSVVSRSARDACTIRKVCLGGFDTPVALRICDSSEYPASSEPASLDQATADSAAWSWERESRFYPTH